MKHGKVTVRQNVIAVTTNKMESTSVFIGPTSWSTSDSTRSRPAYIHFNISTINATLVYSAALEINDSVAPNNIKYTLISLYPNLDDFDKPWGNFWLQASVRQKNSTISRINDHIKYPTKIPWAVHDSPYLQRSSFNSIGSKKHMSMFKIHEK